MMRNRHALKTLGCSFLIALLLICSVPVSASSHRPQGMEVVETDSLLGDSQEPTYSQRSPSSRVARERLGSVGKSLYDALLPAFWQIAVGERASTVISFDENELTAMGLENRYTSQEAIMNGLHEDLELDGVLTAVLHDCPYELYWFDKTGGSSYQFSSYEEDGIWRVRAFYMIYAVSEDYRGASYPSDEEEGDLSLYTVDTAKTAARANLPDIAMEIVAEAEGKSDYLRLLHYAETICKMTSYNSAVAESADSAQYGDAFQLIYVFDGNPETRTVCEGYAKAFQYLCDLTDFADPTLRCYTATGSMDGGPHMWNLVTMGNGETYLVDVTNSDVGSVGEDGGLFLAGASGSITGGYRVSLGWNRSVSYQYGEERAIGFWGVAADSPLRLASRAYSPADLFIYIPTLTYDGESLSVGFPDSGADLICSLEAGNDGIHSYRWSYGWYNDENGTAGSTFIDAPKEAGVYWLRVRADGLDIKDKTVKVEIHPAKLTVQRVTALEKTYDGTYKIDLTDPVLSGILADDEVFVKRMEGFLSAPDAGMYDGVMLSVAELDGADAHNYFVDLSAKIPSEVRVLPKKGVKATLVLTDTEYAYTGEAILPEVRLLDGERIIDPSEYTVTLENNVEIGQAKVRIFDCEGGNYELESLTGTFTIVSETIATETPDPDAPNKQDGGDGGLLLFGIITGGFVIVIIVVTGLILHSVKRRARFEISVPYEDQNTME